MKIIPMIRKLNSKHGTEESVGSLIGMRVAVARVPVLLSRGCVSSSLSEMFALIIVFIIIAGV